MNASEQLQQSYVGQVGRAIEPVFTPMGLDWRVGMGMMSAFVAREVFVSSLAVIFNIADQDKHSLRESLLAKMRTAHFADGTPLFTVASVVGLILFFMIALQCLSTVVVARRETGSWKIPLMQIGIYTGAAYVLTVILVQALRFVGVS